MGPVWFLADPHLYDPEEAYLKEFENWLNYAIEKKVSHIFLMGDLFHYWYLLTPEPESPSWKTMEYLDKVAKDNIPISIVLGNRDFLLAKMEKYFPHIKFYAEPGFEKFGSQMVYLTHGDDICKNDWKYHIYRKVIRSKPVFFSYKILPNFFKRTIASGMSKGSYQTVKRKSKKELEITYEDYLGVRLPDNKHPQALIHGHIHFKRELTLSDSDGSVNVFSIPRWDETGEFLVFDYDKDRFEWSRFEFSYSR